MNIFSKNYKCLVVIKNVNIMIMERSLVMIVGSMNKELKFVILKDVIFHVGKRRMKPDTNVIINIVNSKLI